MKLSRSLGIMFLTLSLLSTTFALSSTITDRANGMAKNVVETNNVIHVYTYTGASSEAGFVSTFNEGETWTAVSVTPKVSTTTTRFSSRLRGSRSVSPYQKSQPKTINSRTNRTPIETEQSAYIKAIDSCVASEMSWNYRDDTCVDKY